MLSFWSHKCSSPIVSSRLGCPLFRHESRLLTLYSFQTFGWQTFKRIGKLLLDTDGLSLTIVLSGASLEINRIYKVILLFSISIQLAFFCVIASMGLWLDFLLNTTEGQYASLAVLLKVIAAVVCVVCTTVCL